MAACIYKIQLIPFFLLALVCIRACAQDDSASAENDSEYVYVRQRVSTDYQNTQQDLAVALSMPIEKNVAIRSGDTMSGIVSRQYGVGRSNAPEAFLMLTSKISELNELSNNSSLTAGDTLSIPDIPPIALSRPNPNNTANSIAKLGFSIDAFKTVSKNNQSKSATSYSQIFDKGRKGASETVVIYKVKRRDAIALQKTYPGAVEAVNDIIRVTLAQPAEPKNLNSEASSVLSEADASTLRRKLSRTAQKEPFLVIFDDNWPDRDDFQSSVKFFAKAISIVREKYRLGAVTLSVAALPQSLSDHNLATSSSSHAHQIKRAIAPLAELQPKEGRVSVVYLPLFRCDPVAKELLTQLVEIDLDAKHMGSVLGIDAAPADVLRANRKLATDIVGRIGTNASGGIVKTDEAVIAAVLTFLRLYSEKANRPYVLNMSWTTPNFTFHLDVPEDAYGLAVVAAGNEGDAQGTTVYDSHRQFAYRSLTPPGDMVAVMNVTVDGRPDCASSLLMTDRELLGFAFSGRLSDSECGTSFAAPRVAWLIAAHESVSPPSRNVSEWRSHLYSELTGLRSKGENEFNKIRLNPGQLFSDVAEP